MKEIETLQFEQANDFKDKALKKIELGSDYSSEYEEQEVSDWVLTDAVETDVAPTLQVEQVPAADAEVDPANMTFKPIDVSRVDPDNASPVRAGEGSKQDKMFDYLR